MSYTSKDDHFVPECLAEAVEAGFAGMKALNGTGAAVVQYGFPKGASDLGSSVKIPYFGTIGEMEVLTEGQALTPTGMTGTDEESTVIRIGKAIEVTDWARVSGVKDPYAVMAAQLIEAFQRAIDSQLITKATSAFTGVLTKDVYSAVTPVKMDYPLLISGLQLWGDESDGISQLCVHSETYGDILRLTETTGRPMLGDMASGPDATRFGGIPVVKSDRNAKTTDSPPKYTSLLMKRNSMVCWVNDRPVVETDRDKLAGTNLAIIDFYCAVHAYKVMPGMSKSGIARLIHNATAA